MELRFTEDHRAIQKLVRDFARKEIQPIIPEMEKGYFPKKELAKMGELGLLGITIPRQYGGVELDFISYIIAIHELSKVSAAIGVMLSVHTSVGTNPILYFGTEEQKKNYIPDLASGKKLGAFCLTEPGAGSDASNLATFAEEHEDGFVINGSKIFITNGGEADVYIVFARTSRNPGAKSISAFIVEKGTLGFHFGKDERKMGLHGSRTIQLSFENMKIRKDQLLGIEGDGFKIAMANLDVGRIGIAAQSLGIAEAAFDAALHQAKLREQFGKSILSFSGVSEKIADMATQVEAARLLTYRAASLQSNNIKCGLEASMAKWFASKTAMEVSIQAIQIFGGIGYTEDYPVERYFRDAKVTEIYEGTSEIQQKVISKMLAQ